MSEKIVQVLRIPAEDIVVTRRVPMTQKTCEQLRELRAMAEAVRAKKLGVEPDEVKIELPTLIKDLVDEIYDHVTKG